MARYVRKDRRIYDFSSCGYCGTGYGTKPGCRHVECPACGSPQCHGNGSGHGTCSVCLHGMLPGWSGNDRACGYKGCTHRAIARAPRVGFVCHEHMDRATVHVYGSRLTLAAYVARRIADRDREWVLIPDGVNDAKEAA
jgi:hypothetical protein